MSKRGDPKKNNAAVVDTSGMDAEWKDIFTGSSTLGKQAGALTPPKPSAPPKVSKSAAADSAMAQWARVDKARAIKGLPSLPKPGKQK